ncbi:MAG TPA: hypothetical protein VGL05_27995 [Kribbella sp.]
MYINTRLAGIIGGVVTAAAIAIPATALTSGGSPSTPSTSKSTSATEPSASKSPSADKSKTMSSDLTSVAAFAGLSESRLQVGLVAAKRAGGNNAVGIAAFAAATGVSTTTAKQVVYAVFGADRSLSGPAGVNVLATRLGVPADEARKALDQIVALSRETAGGIDPRSAAFARIAHELGVSPSRLAGALDAVKYSLAGK